MSNEVKVKIPSPTPQFCSSLGHIQARWSIILIVFVVYMGVLFLVPLPPGMTITNGDEPHYLLLAHSLFYDRDFDPINNYDNEDWRRFYDGYALSPHLSQYHDRIVPHHQMPGLPFFILPAYVLGERIGVLVFLSLCMAMAIVFLYDACCAYVRPEVAFIVCLFLGITYPLIIFSQQIYPEPVAFVLVSLVLAKTLGSSTAQNIRWKALICSTALAFLPLLHYKMAPISVTLFIFFLWRYRGQLKRVICWSTGPILLFAGLMVAWFFILFGELSIDIFRTQTGHGYLSEDLAGIAGLFFDQAHGLFFYAPVYILAFVGILISLCNLNTRNDTWFLIAAYLVYHILMGVWQDWTGGLSATARYIVPILPILVIFVAHAVEHLHQQRQWLQPLSLAGLSIWLTLLVVYDRLLMFGHGQPTSPILREHFQSYELATWFPTFITNTFWYSYGLLILNIGIFITIWYVLSAMNRILIAAVLIQSTTDYRGE